MENNKSCAIRIENCDDIKVHGNEIKGFDEAIVANDSRNISLQDNVFTENDQDIIINTIMDEMNKRFDELKKDKSNKKIEVLKETLSKISIDVISSVITNMIK